jgi:hypothetical protein
MAIPELGPLPGRAGVALPFLRGAAKLGYSPARALQELITLGLSFRRQQTLDLYATLQGRADLERIARGIGENTVLPYDVHNEMQFKLGSNYQYVVEVEAPNLGTSEYITVSSAVRLTAAEIRRLAVRLATSGNYEGFHQFTTGEQYTVITEANRSPGVPNT